MAKQSPKLVKPPAFQCYECRGCGDCCRGLFQITVTPEDRERILAQGWEKEPGFANISLVSRQGDRLVLAHRDDGSCVFLNKQGLCEIHARFGEPAKPLACRLYPFKLIPADDEVRVDIRFDCPMTASGAGKPIAEYATELRELLPLIIPEDLRLPPPWLFPGIDAGWPLLFRVTDAFLGLLRDDSLDFTRRILGCVNFAALLRSPRIARLRGRELDDFISKVTEKIREASRNDQLLRVRPGGMVRATFRQLLGVYGRADRVGEHGATLRRLRDSLRMLSGRGIIPAFREDLPAITFDDIEQSGGIPDGEALDPLLRYYRMHIGSMAFFGNAFYGYSYLPGLNALLLSYPIILWYARAYAAGEGLAAPDRRSIERAIQIVDHQHGITPLLNLPTERYRLCFPHGAEQFAVADYLVWELR